MYCTLPPLYCCAFIDRYTPFGPIECTGVEHSSWFSSTYRASTASDAEIVDFNRSVADVCRMTGVAPGAAGAGYRAITNCGEDGVQEVPHFHLHILGGRMLGRMLAKD